MQLQALLYDYFSTCLFFHLFPPLFPFPFLPLNKNSYLKFDKLDGIDNPSLTHKIIHNVSFTLRCAY